MDVYFQKRRARLTEAGIGEDVLKLVEGADAITNKLFMQANIRKHTVDKFRSAMSSAETIATALADKPELLADTLQAIADREILKQLKDSDGLQTKFSILIEKMSKECGNLLMEAPPSVSDERRSRAVEKWHKNKMWKFQGRSGKKKHTN